MKAWTQWWATPISLWQPPADWAKPWLDLKWPELPTIEWAPLLQTMTWPFAAAAEPAASATASKPAAAPKAANVSVLPTAKAPARRPLPTAAGAVIAPFKIAAKPTSKGAAVEPAAVAAKRAAPVTAAVAAPVRKKVTTAVASKGAAAAKPALPDDLTVIEGIGPKIAAKLAEAGIEHFAALAATPMKRLSSILEAAGPRFKLARPDTWAEQAQLLARGEMAAFEKLTQELRAGLRA